MKIKLETLEILLTLLSKLMGLVIELIEALRKKEQTANGDAAALEEREVPERHELDTVDQQIIDFA